MHEAAMRLGISTDEIEAMVRRGTVKSVVAGWTTMVLASEVERLRFRAKLKGLSDEGVEGANPTPC